MTLGLSCVFRTPLSARGPPTGTCSSGCPGAQESTLVARVIGEEAAAGVVSSPNPVGVLASAWPGGAGIGGEGLQWWFFPLGITQQRCSASLVVQASSTSIPFAELLPPSCPLRMSPHSQPQSSAWVCSHISGPSPRVQWWTPRSGLGSRAVVSTVCRGLTLSCLPLTGAASSSHKRMRLPSVPVSSPKGCRSHPTSSPLPFPSFALVPPG